MAKQDDYVRYTIRVPAALYAQLQDAAGEKSVNAEIVERLTVSFEWPKLSTALHNAIEDSADLNSQSMQQEIVARLDFSTNWDHYYFNPASDNALGLDPDYRLKAIEDQLRDLTKSIRKLTGEPTLEGGGPDDEIPF